MQRLANRWVRNRIKKFVFKILQRYRFFVFVWHSCHLDFIPRPTPDRGIGHPGTGGFQENRVHAIVLGIPKYGITLEA